VGWVLGTDPSEDAVGRARESARLNGLTARFTPGEAEDVLPDVARHLAGSRPMLAVDVGRTGLHDDLLQGILALSPLKVAYRTHDPRVLARDLAALRGAGLAVEALELFDTRPHVPRSEALAVLAAPDAGERTRRAPRRRVVRARG
jgi:23S rRNA (uracil1939-C5)-methyltransferase